MYFKSVGKKNTKIVLDVTRNFVEKNKIRDVVVASTTGYTGKIAYETFKKLDVNIVVVTHYTGFLKPNHQQFSKKVREYLERKGVKILTCQHTFGGLNKLQENSIGGIVANTLRLFGEGTKVAVEIVLMATDAGMIESGKDIVSIAGTGRGADTAILIKSANSTRLWELKIKRIIAKPEVW